MTSAGGFIKAIESGSKHLVIRRFTFRYPEQKLKFVGDGYQFDPKRGVGIAGYRRQIFQTSARLPVCAIRVKAPEATEVRCSRGSEQKAIIPRLTLASRILWLCVDACPFSALFMTNA